MSDIIYCTYLTVYKGNKLPPFYIGSSSLSKLLNGYHGSPSSKKYKSFWDLELKLNPHLFKTLILTKHTTREEALIRELKFQESLKVIESRLYINLSYARVNGFFGMSVFGNDHPSFGRKVSDITKQKQSLAKRGSKPNLSIEERSRRSLALKGNTFRKNVKHTTDTKEKISKSGTGLKRSYETKKKISDRLSNRTFSSEHRENIKESWVKRKLNSKICPHCQKECVNNYNRYHGDNCKKKFT